MSNTTKGRPTQRVGVQVEVVVDLGCEATEADLEVLQSAGLKAASQLRRILEPTRLASICSQRVSLLRADDA